MADYTKYDYQSLVDGLTEKLKDTEGWGDAYNSSMGQAIIQNVAFMVDQLHYMMERRSQENYMTTARMASSIRSIANIHGYRPRRRVSARGTVRLQLVDSEGSPITTEGTIFLPKYTPVTYNEIDFLTNEDVTIEPGESFADLEIIQGSLATYTEDPLDTASNMFKRGYILFSDYLSMEENSLEITSDGSEFTDVQADRVDAPPLEALAFATATDKVYDVRIANDGLRIIFGDDTFGFAPKADITVQWIDSLGVDVKITKIGVNFAFEADTLEDDVIVVPKNQYNYTLKNLEAIDGGLTEESSSEIKLKSPEYVRTGNRAVVKDDFVFWSKRAGIGGVVDVFVYGEEEKGIDVFNMNNVYITYLTSDGSNMSASELASFRSYMDELKPLTTHLVVANAEQIVLDIALTVKRHPELEISNAELFAYLKEQMEDYFKFEEGSLSKQFYYSEFIDFFHNLTITKNNIVYRVAQFVYATVKPMKLFSIPSALPYEISAAYNIDIVAGSDGDAYTLDLTYVDVNGNTQTSEVTYTQTAGNTATDIASSLATSIDALDGLTASNASGTLTIDIEHAGNTATVTNADSTVPANIPVHATVILPPRTLNNEAGTDLFTTGSIEIFEDVDPYTIIGTDDGAGVVTVNGDSTGTIDYTNGKMTLPLFTTGNYVIRYQQDNDEQNVFSNPNTAITVSPSKDALSDVTEKITTIEIMS